MHLLNLFQNRKHMGLPVRCSALLFPFLPTLLKDKAGNIQASFASFFIIAIGSAAELDTQLVVAIELGYSTAENAQPLFDLILEIRKMTYALINKLPR